ncbi:MAG: acylphosphatase, partial [Actinobacteria bacterium]|nr:acylphosphatase [Actinomycetota bacterium]
MATILPVERRAFVVRGIVQGVGFRPFVYGIARAQQLVGFVLNDGDGVVIEVEGEEPALERFAQALVDDAPPLAQVDSVESRPLEPRGETEFQIRVSETRGGTALIPADVATCDDCLLELFDPQDRRYRYPFINCTQCGPRFT